MSPSRQLQVLGPVLMLVGVLLVAVYMVGLGFAVMLRI